MTPAPEAERPLPCPFCSATLQWQDVFGWVHPEKVIECAAERLVTRTERQLAAWNRRAPDAHRPVGSEALDEMERLAKAATEGPYTLIRAIYWYAWQAVDEGKCVARFDSPSDANFFLAANPTAVLALVAQARALTAERDRLRAALEATETATAKVADAAENLVIAIGMGWDLEGVIEQMRAALGAP